MTEVRPGLWMRSSRRSLHGAARSLSPRTTTRVAIGDHFDLILTDMQFHPSNELVRFAVGEGGAFYTNDGVNWIRLLHSGAFPGRPSNCYYDWISVPSDPALYVGFAGRSLVKIDQLPGSTVV